MAIEIQSNSTDPLKAGDSVTYADVNLWSYRGTIREIGTRPNGGNCLVAWTREHIGTSAENLSNLRRVVER